MTSNNGNNQNNQIDRAEAVAALAGFRKEWEEAIDELSLVNVDASVGLLLADITMVLKLSSAELNLILGEKLRKEVIRTIRARR